MVLLVIRLLENYSKSNHIMVMVVKLVICLSVDISSCAVFALHQITKLIKKIVLVSINFKISLINSINFKIS